MPQGWVSPLINLGLPRAGRGCGRGEAEAVARRLYGEVAAGALFRAASTGDFIEQTHGISPMTEWICAMARGVIIHSGFGVDRVLASCPGPVYQVPLPFECPPLPAGRPEARPAGEDRFRLGKIRS